MSVSNTIRYEWVQIFLEAPQKGVGKVLKQGGFVDENLLGYSGQIQPNSISNELNFCFRYDAGLYASFLCVFKGGK